MDQVPDFRAMEAAQDSHHSCLLVLLLGSGIFQLNDEIEDVLPKRASAEPASSDIAVVGDDA